MRYLPYKASLAQVFGGQTMAPREQWVQHVPARQSNIHARRVDLATIDKG